MSTEDWRAKLSEWKIKHGIQVRPPMPEAGRVVARAFLVGLPTALSTFYEVTNGLRHEWFNILPFESPEDPKSTWDSITRANDPEHLKYLGGDKELLHRFVVMAEIGPGECACVDRFDGSIWFEDDEGLHQTDMSFVEFIETSLQEVDEL